MSTRLPSKTILRQNYDATPTASQRSSGEPLSSETNDDESRDEGSLDLPDEYGDWKDDYADAVGISRWREL